MAVPFAASIVRAHGLPFDLDRAFAASSGEPLASSNRWLSASSHPTDRPAADSQNAKQEMSGQVRGRSPPKHVLPTDLETTDVEIAQARDLDVQRRRIRQRRADLDARHAGSGCAAFGLLAGCLGFSAMIDAVDPVTVDLLRVEFQLEPLAHDSSQEAAH